MLPPLDPSFFDLDPERLWVMHCAEGPVPRASADAIQAFLSKELRPWEMRFEEDFLGLPAQVRTEAAKVIGAQAKDISLTMNTSTGLVTVALGYPWDPGDEVLAPLGEFPANVWPWMALRSRGIAFREVPLWAGHRGGVDAWDSTAPAAADDPEARLLAAIGPRTRILALSWVRFQDGLKLDLARLGEGCAAKGVDLVVDGIQGAGTHLPDLRFVSAFATGGHKGLLTPQGIGFLWTREAFRLHLHPAGTWLSVEDGSNFHRPSTDFNREFLKDGRRLEPGGYPGLACAGFLAALQTLNGSGIPIITAHVEGLQTQFLGGLRALPQWAMEADRLGALLAAGRLGPILSLHHQGRGQDFLQHRLRSGMQAGIYASVREGYLRIAFHGFHTGSDAERILEWLTQP
jgi:cysteine desulfurase/selenocysteine lyase